MLDKLSISLCLVFLSVIMPQQSFAEMYKCTNNESTSYQATPCESSSEDSKIIKSVKPPSKIRQCNAACDSQSSVCVSKLEDGAWNKDGGLEICKEEQNICKVACEDPEEAKLLKVDIESKRSSYELIKNNEKRVDALAQKYVLEELENCKKARNALKSAKKAWKSASFTYHKRRKLTEEDENNYLNAIESAELDVKYDCN